MDLMKLAVAVRNIIRELDGNYGSSEVSEVPAYALRRARHIVELVVDIMTDLEASHIRSKLDSEDVNNLPF